MLAHTNAVRWVNVISAVFCFLDFLTFEMTCAAGLVFLVVGAGESEGLAGFAAFGALAFDALAASGTSETLGLAVLVAVMDRSNGDSEAVGGLGWGFGLAIALALALAFSGADLGVGVAVGAAVSTASVARLWV